MIDTRRHVFDRLPSFQQCFAWSRSCSTPKAVDVSFVLPETLPGRPSLPLREYAIGWQGWPIFLLAEASLHTQNIKANGRVSLLCQTPREANGQPVSPAIV